jgi:hypothetical protein
MIRLPNLPAALKRLPLPVGNSFVAFLLLSVAGLPCLLDAESEGGSRGLRLPEPLQENEFESLKARSPFLRTLDPSESLILAGIAIIDGNYVATLRERETKKTHILSTTNNEEGWRIVGVEGNPANLASVAAKISVAEEVFTVRYDQQQLKPPPPNWRTTIKLSKEQQEDVVEQAKNFREGIRGDGHRGPPPPELVKRLERLSQRQREEIIARIHEMRNRGVESEVRQQAIIRMADRAIASGTR